MSKKLNLAGFTLHITEKPGDELTLLMLHGNSMSSRIWEKQLEDKRFDKYRMIAFDLPGHGDSSWSSEPHKDYNLPAYASVLVDVIERLELDNYILVGYSLGGNIAVEALPKLVGCKGVFLFSTVLVADPGSLPQAMMPDPAIGHLFKADVDEEIAKNVVDLFFLKGSEEDKEFYIQDFLQADPHTRSYLGKSVGEGKISNNIKIIQQSNVPIAFTTGTHDRYLNLRYVRSLRLAFWEGLDWIPEAGHLPHWENPVVFNRKLKRFIKDCQKSAK